MSGTKQLESPPHSKAAKTADDEDSNPLNVEHVRKVIFSLLPIKTLCRYKCISRAVRADADQAIANRTTRVTDDDVAKNKHVAKLRQLIKEAEPGQTIELAPGRYLLGDDSMTGHCRERIVYPSEMREHEDNGDFDAALEAEEAWESYFGDISWNKWKRGHGGIRMKKAGVRLTGRTGPGRTIFAMKAHSSISAEPVAVQIWARDILVQNIDFEGHCTAISVGNFTFDVANASNPFIAAATTKCSAGIHGCNFRGVSIRICTNSSAKVTDCIVEDDTGGFDGKASVQVGRKAEVHLTRTRINSSSRHAYQTYFQGRSDEEITNDRNGYGGLFLHSHSIAYLDEVEMMGNVPAGIVVSSRKVRIILGGPLSFSGNERGVVVERGPQSNHRFVLQMVSDMMSDFREEYGLKEESKKDKIPCPSQKRAYPGVCRKTTSFYKYKEDTKMKNTENYKSLANKYVESARQIFVSDGSKKGDESLEWMLSRIQRIERGRSAIGNSGDHGEIIKHDEGFCPPDCEFCQWDVDLPNDDNDSEDDE